MYMSYGCVPGREGGAMGVCLGGGAKGVCRGGGGGEGVYGVNEGLMQVNNIFYLLFLLL